MQKNKLKNYLELHLLVFIWGFTAILGALIHLDALPLVWYRMLIAVAFIGLYFIFTKKSFRTDRRSLGRFLLTGIIISLHWIAFFYAIKVSNVSITLAMLSTGALFTSFIEPLFFKRKIDPLEILFGLIIVAGLMLIFKVENGYTEGIIFALIAAFLSALFSVLSGLYVKEYPPHTLSFYQLFFGVLSITVYLFFAGHFTSDFFVLTTSDFVYLLILGGICTSYTFIASMKLMRYITPYTLLLTINLEPVYGIILAVFIFGEKEKMSTQFYLGAVIILLTVIIEAVVKHRRKKRLEEQSKRE
ncbi:MAG: EamA family transporter [Flavobacteriaceae bacterium]|nr:EamA family transporter [Flavobacteriaceae bacterium]